MGQSVKTGKPITKRPGNNFERKFERNSAHKEARKLAAKNAQKKLSKPPDKKTKTLSKRKTQLKTKSKTACAKHTPFILIPKATNILYYTKNRDDNSHISEPSAFSSLNITPQIDHILPRSEPSPKPKSFSPITAVRDPLAELIILQRAHKKAKKQKSSNCKVMINDAPSMLHIENIIDVDKPLPRSSSLAISGQGPLHIMAYWLRTSRYKLLNIFKSKKAEKEAQKKRSKADILNEIAGLRAENAMLRKRLGKKLMPNGRKVFEKA